ncbi:hypothetical protein LSAT2_019633 [Lamellibrachia satsuma]|nr:hypothetical protein LSAT2_019633 [Lamellibrachia satsuma]
MTSPSSSIRSSRPGTIYVLVVFLCFTSLSGETTTASQADFVWSDEWMVYNGHTYRYFSDLTISGHRARSACRSLQGLLVSVNTQAEHDFLAARVLRLRTLSAFIGGTDEDEEGRWRWADGTEMALPTSPWHAWFEGEPDNHDDVEHCAVVSNYMYWAVRKRTLGEYVWRDFSCLFNNNNIQGYICERSKACESTPCFNNATCRYVGGKDEFTCDCLTGFVGDRCQFEVRPDEAWTHCGETHLTSDRGVISSPLYPRLYPPNVNCAWLVEAEANRTVLLTYVK